MHASKVWPCLGVERFERFRFSVLRLLWSADCKRGRRKGATSKNVKNRQKVSKSFSTLFDNFRAGQKTSKIVKKCQKVFRHFSTLFARHLFSGPFCNPLIWCKGVFCVSAQFNRKGRFLFRLWSPKNGSGGSGSAFGSWKNGSGFLFQFGSWTVRSKDLTVQNLDV